MEPIAQDARQRTQMRRGMRIALGIALSSVFLASGIALAQDTQCFTPGTPGPDEMALLALPCVRTTSNNALNNDHNGATPTDDVFTIKVVLHVCRKATLSTLRIFGKTTATIWSICYPSSTLLEPGETAPL